jgi:hypothetical protein
MLNEKKIRWMTRASIYEKYDGREDLRHNDYFLSDYVRFGTLRNLVGVTLAYLFILGIVALYNLDSILTMAANLKLGLLIREIVLIYVVLLLIYAGISIIFYAWQYQSGKGRVRKYYRMLKLIEKYEQEEK